MPDTSGYRFMATVIAGKGRAAELATRLRDKLGVELPDGPQRFRVGNIGFAGLAPGTWLATHEYETVTFMETLADAVGDCASICDQSDGYAVLRISGAHARSALARLIPVDLHPRVFSVDDVAATLAAHTSVLVWRLPDDTRGQSVFEIAVFRSYAESFREMLGECTAGLGSVDIA